MAHEVEIISDGDGVAVIGKPTAVERFLEAAGLMQASTPSSDFRSALRAGTMTAQAGAEVMAGSGRWVKLTAESAQSLKKFPLMETDTPGVSHAVLGQRGSIKKWLQIESPGSLSANPALLSGAAGFMAQKAMEQAIDEIVEYLKAIDAKLNDVLRAQTNQVLARLDGIDLAVREAMSVRSSVGRVSEVTWSKVQASSQTIHETQGYALRQLGDIADKLESKKKVNDLVDVARAAEADVQKWLVVLARCFELHDAVAVLELDRVLDAAPNELDMHRVGLKAARQDRLELVVGRMDVLLARMEAAASTANSKVLFNPMQSPAIIKSSNQVATDVHEFRELLGIESGIHSAESRRWKDAAAERLEKTREQGATGLGTAKRLGGEGRNQAAAVGKKLSGRIGGLRRRGADTDEYDAET